MTLLKLEFFNASVDADKSQTQAIEKATKEKKRQQQFLVGSLLIVVFALFGVLQAQQKSQWEQLVSRVYDAKPSPKLLSDLDEFLKGVETRTGAGNLDLQLSYYRKALFAANRLNQIRIKSEIQKLETVHDEAEKQLGTLINENKLDELKNRLNTISTKETKETKETEEALEETRRILLEETGADLDQSEGLSSDDEGRQIPCKTLEEIGKMWTKKLLPQPCGWGTSAEAEGCKALGGKTLTLAVFKYDYGSFPFLRDRLKTCRLV
jgi:hypothetical protein